MLSDCLLSVNLFCIVRVRWVGGGGGVRGGGRAKRQVYIANFYSQTVVFQFHVTVVVHFRVCISVDLFAAYVYSHCICL